MEQKERALSFDTYVKEQEEFVEDKTVTITKALATSIIVSQLSDERKAAIIRDELIDRDEEMESAEQEKEIVTQRLATVDDGTIEKLLLDLFPAE